MFWADKIVDDFLAERKQIIDTKESIIIRDEKTPSGRVHVGSMRGVAMHGVISRVLAERGVENTYLYEFNDFDAFDSIPAYLDEKKYIEHLGKPLCAVPAPDLPAQAGGDENYAQYFANEFARTIEASGFYPQFYYSSDEYRAGKYNDVIRTALERADDIRRIYKEVSGGERPEGWLPIMVVCEKCGKVATTRATSFDAEQVSYVCDQEIGGATPCGHTGSVSPFNGNAKLPWKVEWAAKFRVYDVDIEGAGKDHATKGGSKHVANEIARQVFEYSPPHDFWYEFFLVGGKKMSSSKGAGSSASEVASLLPPHIFQLALLGRQPKRAINFDPEGDTIPLLFDQYDTLAEKYATGIEDDETRLFGLIHREGDIHARYLPRFSQVAFMIQMPHMDLEDEVAKMKEAPLSEADKKELKERAYYARKWLDTYASERYIYELQLERVPEEAKEFSEGQKAALRRVLTVVRDSEALDGQELHTALHDIKAETDTEPKAFFGALYLAFLGKESGPKIGWFLSVLPKDFIEQRLEEVTS
ncbi:MAG: lysine--tRNA ligase [Candidatus Pacebacteria bacterium]|nr:lysine--tRNA ligase [Candidatus Paceibacterota bacterium]